MSSEASKFDFDSSFTLQSTDRVSEEDTRVSDAQYMMEALHGTSAAMAAVAIACDQLVHGNQDEATFWMRVYRAIVATNPMAQIGGRLFH